jgi:hypothetical protein
MTTPGEHADKIAMAYDAGRRVGFGVSAMVLSFVTFLSLLGAEKAILAIVLGALAIRGSKSGTLSRRLGRTAIALGVVFLLTMGIVLMVFWDQAVEFVRLLQQLS